MVAIVGEAGVRLRPEASGFAGEADREISSGMPGVAKKAAGFFAAAFAVIEVGGFLKDAIGAASDLSESTSKVGVVFGSASQQVLDFASNASTAFGQSRGQALEAAGTFGNLLRSIGLTEQASADMSTRMVGLASDLASFNNTDPAEALDALRAGLTGETEPLKRYGINLNDATLKQEAMRLGLDTSGSTLSANTKAQAAYSLIMQQSSLAQGDFARTSAGLANQQRIMASQWTDLSANIGGLFVPMVANASGLLTGGLMPALLRITSGLPAFGTALGAIGDTFRVGFSDGLDAVNGATEGMSGLGFSINQVAGFAGNLGAIFAESFADGRAGADLLAADGLDGLAARAGTAAFRIRQDLGAAFLSVRASVAPALAPLAGTFANVAATGRAAFGQIFAGLGGGGDGGGLAGFAAMIGGALNRVIPIITPILQQVIGAVQGFLPVIGQTLATLGPIIGSVVSQIGPLLGQIGPMLAPIIPVVVQIAGLWQHVLMAAFQALLPVLPVVVQAIGTLVTTLVSGLAPIFTALAPVIGQVVTTISGALTGALTALLPVLPVLVGAVAQVAQILGGALLSVIQSLAPVIPTLVGVVGQLAGVLGGALAAALGAIAPVLPQLAEVVGQVATMFAGLLASVLQALLPILPPLVQALMLIAQSILGALMGALQAILPLIPQLVNLFVLLVTSALVPLLPMLPMIADLISLIIAAVAPMLPLVVQVVALLIQLAISALMPLMPIIEMGIRLFVGIVGALMPIIGILLAVVGGFIRFASTILGIVLGFVTRVIGFLGGLVTWFVSLPSRIIGAIGDFGTLLYNKGRDLIQGLVNGIGAAASFVGNIGKNVVNAIIRFINDRVIDGINNLVDFTIAGIHINPPDIPHIPTLHMGGVVDWNAGNEGLALLRSGEMVATPEQRVLGEGLLEGLLTGRLPASATAGAAGPGAEITQHIYAAEGMGVGELSARIATDLGWALSSGSTTPAPRFAGSTT